VSRAKQDVESEMKAMIMLAGTNKAKPEDLRTHLQNSYNVGRNEYPGNTTELLSMMNNWKPKPAQGHYNYAQVKAGEDDGLNIAQEGTNAPQQQQPEPEKKGVTMLQSKKGNIKGVLKASSFNTVGMQDQSKPKAWDGEP
jgi:hypothetical protein